MLKFVTCAAIMACVFAAKDASACLDLINEEDDVMARTMDCDQTFIDWSHYHIDPRRFSNAGYEDPCNPALPYGKLLSATWILGNGLPRHATRAIAAGTGLGGDMQFHGRWDYMQATHKHGDGNLYHDNIYTLREESRGGAVAKYSRGSGRHITLFCENFDSPMIQIDPGSGFPDGSHLSNPAARISTLVHENWHSYKEKIGKKPANNRGGHRGGPIGACADSYCDHWYRHNPQDSPYGDMHSQTRFHSVYQMEIEYNCDVALYAESDFVPDAVARHARAIANKFMNDYIIETPSFRCAAPDMFSTK